MGMEDGIRFLGDVQRLTLGPEDVLVLSVEHELTLSQADRLRAYLSDCLPGRKCIVLSGDCKLGVLSTSAESD